jgi:hypothetical protein
MFSQTQGRPKSCFFIYWHSRLSQTCNWRTTVFSSAASDRRNRCRFVELLGIDQSLVSVPKKKPEKRTGWCFMVTFGIVPLLDTVVTSTSEYSDVSKTFVSSGCLAAEGVTDVVCFGSVIVQWAKKTVVRLGSKVAIFMLFEFLLFKGFESLCCFFVSQSYFFPLLSCHNKPSVCRKLNRPNCSNVVRSYQWFSRVITARVSLWSMTERSCRRLHRWASIDYRCDNRRFWLSAHNCQVPTPTSQNLEL